MAQWVIITLEGLDSHLILIKVAQRVIITLEGLDSHLILIKVAQRVIITLEGLDSHLILIKVAQQVRHLSSTSQVLGSISILTWKLEHW